MTDSELIKVLQYRLAEECAGYDRLAAQLTSANERGDQYHEENNELFKRAVEAEMRLVNARKALESPMATVKTYDSRCYDLAGSFLHDEPDINSETARHALALKIQQCIEDEIYFMRNADALKTAKGEDGMIPVNPETDFQRSPQR